MSKITDKNFEVVFKKSRADVIDSAGKVIISANRVNNLYCVTENYQEMPTSAYQLSEEPDLGKWHRRRLGHLNFRDLVEYSRKGMVCGLKLKTNIKIPSCNIYTKAKMSRIPFPKASNSMFQLLEVIAADVFGPTRTESNGGTDQCSRWTEVQFMKSKSEVFELFKKFVNYVDKQKDVKVKFLISDNGSEYVNKDFDNCI